MILVIDTSSQHAGLLLWDTDKPVAILTWKSEYNLTSELTPGIKYLLDQANTNISELIGIIISLGPGTFNTLRIGMSVGKGLSLGAKIPMIGISTLEAEAYPYAGIGLPIYSFISVGKDQVAWAGFQKLDGQWHKLHSEQIGNPDTIKISPSKKVFCGEGLLNHASSLSKSSGRNTIFIDYPGLALRLWSLATLGSENLANGLIDDPNTLQPLYIKNPNITKPNPPRRIKP